MTVRFRGSKEGASKPQAPAKVKFAQDDDRASLMKSEEDQDTKRPGRDLWKKARSNKLLKILSRLSPDSNIVEPGIRSPPLEGSHPNYPFENIVFQGGGAKGIIYGGVIQALEELEMLPYLKRFAGASAGCGPALFLSLGLDAAQIKEETDSLDMLSFFDCKGGHIPFLKNFILGYHAFTKLGMHPAQKGIDHFGAVLKKYTGNPDLTFVQLYQRFGRELCIAVSNVSRQQSEFCHVNTTPDMPIRMAIRASMSLPVLWEPVQLFEGETYVDGGLFNNFPLKAFDGWFLSTKEEDGMFAKLAKSNPRMLKEDTPCHEVIATISKGLATSFKEANMATIGFRASDDEAPDEAAYATYLVDLEKRLRIQASSVRGAVISRESYFDDIPFPDTKLAKAYLAKRDEELEVFDDIEKYEDAYVEMCRWFIFHSNVIGVDSHVHPHAVGTTALLKTFLSDPPRGNFSPDIFGYPSWEHLVNELDVGKEGYITVTDVGKFWEQWGIRHAYMKNRKPKPITSLAGLGGEMLNSMYNVAEEALLRDPMNARRICSLGTKYVGLLDLELEQEDKDFLYAIGKRDTIAWIKKRAHDMGK